MPSGRGKLLFPLLAEIGRIDYAATEANAQGGAPAGYDPDFQEPIVYSNPSNSDQIETTRTETTAFVPAQIRSFTMDQLAMMFGGNSPSTVLEVTFHLQDLEDAGLVNAVTLQPLIGSNDRLVSLRDRCDETRVVQRFPDPPGLYATQTRASGFKANRNLLVCIFQSRKQG